MNEDIILSEHSNHMKSYFLVSRIYDIFFKLSTDENEEPIEFKSITINPYILDYIRETNFVFLGNIGIIDDIKELKKVGMLLNFEVFLDPTLSENKVIFYNDKKDKKYELLVID